MLGNFTYLGILVIKKSIGKTWHWVMLTMYLYIFFSFFTVQCNMWNHSSLTRDLTCTPCIESSEP